MLKQTLIFVVAFFVILVPKSVFAQETPPAAPEGAWVHYVDEERIQISWKSVSDTDSYVAYLWSKQTGKYEFWSEWEESYLTSNATGVGLSEEFRLFEFSSDFGCGVYLDFVITAKNSVGESAPSQPAIHYFGDCEPLAVPELQSLEEETIHPGDTLTLTWTYQSESVEKFNFELERDGKPQSGGFTTFKFHKIVYLPAGEYRWKVQAVRGEELGEWSQWSYFTVTEEVIQVSTPELTSPVSGTEILSGTEQVLTWQGSADGYWLEIEGSGEYLVQKFLTETTFTTEPLLPGWYTWKVQAEAQGTKSEWSEKWTLSVDAPLEPVIDCNTWQGSSEVKLFFLTSCSGEYVDLDLGSHNLMEVGMDNSVSSIFIPEGWSVRIFQDPGFSGRTKCYGETMWNLGEDKWWNEEQVVGNSISSLTVFDNTSCDSLGKKSFLPLLAKP